MNSLVRTAVASYAQIRPGWRITYRSESEGLKALADAELILLALSQLLNHACDWSEPGSEVAVRVGEEGGTISVRVSSPGNAIPAYLGDRIFDRTYAGTLVPGLAMGGGGGLYVARKIAMAHGGTIDSTRDGAEPGGVTLQLSLPRAETLVNQEITAQRAADPDGQGLR